jgi:L-ascorbate metabolism protein UlaG (beta-lactamase superfamily)
MRITWYGHAAFRIEAEGLRIILDPYRSPDSGGYAPVSDPADIVAVSHDNDRYHSHLGQIVPPFEVVRGLELPPEGRVVGGIRFEAIRVYETPRPLTPPRRPLPSGPSPADDEVTILHFRADGLHVAFLGDLGHPLIDDELAPIRGAKVVLIPAGGPPTIDYPDIPALLDAIDPRLVVPMHYKTPKINLDIQPVERILDAMPDDPVDRTGRSTIEVRREDLPDRRRIILLEPAR